MTDPSQDSSGTTEAWRTLAARSGIDLEALASHTVDGQPVGPIYPAGSEAPVSGRPGWRIYQRIDCSGKDPAAAIDAAIRGATGTARLALVSLADNWPVLIQRIRPTQRVDLRVETPRTIDGPEAVTPVLEQMRAFSGRFGFVCDPIAAYAVFGAPSADVEAAFDTILEIAGTMDEFGISGQAMTVDGRPWHDAGASEVQELAAALGSAVTYLRRAEAKGVDVEAAAGRLGVILAADCDQFLTIAKFRAARLLFARLTELASLNQNGFGLHAETSWRMMCRRDPYLNLLRTTTATLAAATGGADTLSVLPFDLGSDPFADRMARNVQTIALEEASLGRVADPGAGSGAIEALTDELAAAAWAAFQMIEAEGGLLASVRAGTIQGRITETSAIRQDRIARREIEIVGVTAHIDRDRPLPPPAPGFTTPETATDTIGGKPMLRRARLAEPFEQLCDRARVLAETGTPPSVLMIKIGHSGETATAVAAAREALAIGGISASDGVDLNDEGSPIAEAEGAAVCLVAPAGTPPQILAAATARLRDAGAGFVLLCREDGCHPVSPGADAVLSADTDLAEVLSNVLDAIAIIAKNRQNHTG